MDNLSPNYVIKKLTAYALTVPSVKMTPAHFKAYYAVLKNLEPKSFDAAILDCMAASEPFIRSAGQIYSMARDHARTSAGLPTAERAWADSIKYVADGKAMFSPVNDFARRAFRETCSDDTLWNTKPAAIPHLKRAFCQQYNDAVDGAEKRLLSTGVDYLRPAIGAGHDRRGLRS